MCGKECGCRNLGEVERDARATSRLRTERATDVSEMAGGAGKGAGHGQWNVEHGTGGDVPVFWRSDKGYPGTTTTGCTACLGPSQPSPGPSIRRHGRPVTLPQYEYKMHAAAG